MCNGGSSTEAHLYLDMMRQGLQVRGPQLISKGRTLEYFFTCPYCWQRISMVLDISSDSQTYVEDCEVCCKPIEISYSIEEDRLTGFDARRL
jgi:hypothetical protein